MPKPHLDLLFRKNLETIGFEILKVADLYKKYDAPYLTSPKTIKFYEIMFVTSGMGEHSIDFQTYDLRPGKIAFIGKNQVHSWSENLTFDAYLIFFTENFLYKNQIQFNDLSYEYPYNTTIYGPIVDVGDDQQLSICKSLFELIYKEYTHTNYEARQDVLQSLLGTFFMKVNSQFLGEETAERQQSKNLFVRLQKTLEKNLSNTRHADDYVQMLDVSYYHLNSVVRKFTNTSFKKFIDNMVILNAKKLLSDPENNISEIAYSLGFDEPTNFTKFFKKHSGQTPKDFRDLLLRR